MGSALGQQAPGASAEMMVSNKLRNSVAILARNGQAIGPAVFISTDGYAVANSLIIQRGAADLVTSAGLTYKFEVEATDSASQLSLLRTTVKPAGVTAVHAADATDGLSGTIFAILPSGIQRGELTGGEKFGLDQKTKRTFPIQEVRVEAKTLQMGGALLFSGNGRLIGALFAAQAQENSQFGNVQAYQQRASTNVQDLNQGGYSQNGFLNNGRALGPQGLVVAYTPAWEVTSKAVAGFLSPAKKPQYGVLGIFVMDNKLGGVEITSLVKGTGAESAGLNVGDIVIGIDGALIRNQIDFSRAVYRLVPGSTVAVSYTRKGVSNVAQVTVGTQLAEVGERQQSSTVSTDSLGIR